MIPKYCYLHLQMRRVKHREIEQVQWGNSTKSELGLDLLTLTLKVHSHIHFAPSTVPRRHRYCNVL